jgi:hypothetical protein
MTASSRRSSRLTRSPDAVQPTASGATVRRIASRARVAESRARAHRPLPLKSFEISR